MTKKLLLIAFGVLLAISIAEVVARGFAPKDSVFWDNPMMMPYSGGTFDPKSTAESMHDSRDPNRAQKYVPDANRWYRLDPEPSVPAAGQLVLNFGDSSTWGWGLGDRHDAYATALNELAPEGVTSINLGVPYYSSLQGLRYLQEVLPQYAGRVIGVTLYFGNNDATENGSADDATLQRTHDADSAQHWLVAHSALYRWLRSAVATFKAGQFNRIVRVTSEAYEANLRAMIELCQHYGVPVVLIEPPVHLSWKPAHIKVGLSLSERVRNPWTRVELAAAQAWYEDGIAHASRQDDAYEWRLQEAVEHDWVIPRIKFAWRNRLHAFDTTPGVTVVRLPKPWILSEFPYVFVDYCHPSLRTHNQITTEIAAALGW